MRWIAKTGAPWRDLPERFGTWNSVFQWFHRWSHKGVWAQIAEMLGLEAWEVFDTLDGLLDEVARRGNERLAWQQRGK